jgi:hypothetical protein
MGTTKSPGFYEAMYRALVRRLEQIVTSPGHDTVRITEYDLVARAHERNIKEWDAE